MTGIKKRHFFMVSPVLIGGVLLVLVPIFVVMTLDRLDRHNQFFTDQLFEKGVSLIRTFEAGSRSGMLTMRWGGDRIQNMLLETALQPEVDYILIASTDGKIMAHSDAGLVGQQLSDLPVIENDDPLAAYHRRAEYQGEDVFEVYKWFAPVLGRIGHGRMHHRDPGGRMPMMNRIQALRQSQSLSQSKNMGQADNEDWSRPYLNPTDGKLPKRGRHYIILGLSMKAAEVAKARLLKETIWQGALYLLLGCAGIFSILAFQAYRSTRASLSSVQAYSDTIVENMPSGLITCNNQGILTVNQAARQMLTEPDAALFERLKPLMENLRQSGGVLNRELDIENGDHRTMHLDVTASAATDADTGRAEYVFLFRDLTQIHELKQQVETNRRLAAIGKLAAGVAHEIRNPLSSIKGFATYFGKRSDANTSDREMADIMVREVERINRSITQLLEFAKPMKVEKSRVDLDQLISHSVKLIQPDLDKKHLTASCQINLAQPVIFSDGDRINQVLLNLYMNAIEAMTPKFGRLNVAVSDKGAGMIEITVQDNGGGISQAHLEKVFDPYFTTRPTGTGLGLSIVHRIVDNLGGTIRIDSRPEKGTCIRITLPTGDVDVQTGDPDAAGDLK